MEGIGSSEVLGGFPFDAVLSVIVTVDSRFTCDCESWDGLGCGGKNWSDGCRGWTSSRELEVRWGGQLFGAAEAEVGGDVCVGDKPSEK